MARESIDSMLERDKRYYTAHKNLEDFIDNRSDLTLINELNNLTEPMFKEKIEMYQHFSLILMLIKSSYPRLMVSFDTLRYQKVVRVSQETVENFKDAKMFFTGAYELYFDESQHATNYLNENTSDSIARKFADQLSSTFHQARTVFNITENYILNKKFNIFNTNKILDLSRLQNEILYDVNVLLLDIMMEIKFQVKDGYVDFNHYETLDAERNLQSNNRYNKIL